MKSELLSTLLFLIVGIAVLVMYFPINHRNLLSFSGVAVTLLFPMLFISVLASTVYSMIRVLKARRNIKRGLSLEKPTLKNARRRIVALHGTGLTVVFILILAIVVDAFFDLRITLSLLGPALGLTIGLGIRYIIKKKSTDRNSSIFYVVLSILIVLFSMTIINSSLTNRIAKDTYRKDPIPDGYPVVTMVELMEESQHGTLANREFNASKSPVTLQRYDYLEVRELEEKSQGVRIRYYKTVHPYFAEVIFNGVTEDLRKGIKWRGMRFLTKTIIRDDRMKASWNMDHLALTEERDELILHKENTVVHLSGEIDFDDRQTRDLIVNRLFIDSQL